MINKDAINIQKELENANEKYIKLLEEHLILQKEIVALLEENKTLRHIALEMLNVEL